MQFCVWYSGAVFSAESSRYLTHISKSKSPPGEGQLVANEASEQVNKHRVCSPQGSQCGGVRSRGLRFSLENIHFLRKCEQGLSAASRANHHRAGIQATIPLDETSSFSARWWFRSRKTMVSAQGCAQTLQIHWFKRLGRLAAGRAVALALPRPQMHPCCS